MRLPPEDQVVGLCLQSPQDRRVGNQRRAHGHLQFPGWQIYEGSQVQQPIKYWYFFVLICWDLEPSRGLIGNSKIQSTSHYIQQYNISHPRQVLWGGLSEDPRVTKKTTWSGCEFWGKEVTSCPYCSRRHRWHHGSDCSESNWSVPNFNKHITITCSFVWRMIPMKSVKGSSFNLWGSHCHVSQLSTQTLGRANMAKQSCLLLREWTSLKHEKCSEVASDFVFWVQPLRAGILPKQVL